MSETRRFNPLGVLGVVVLVLLAFAVFFISFLIAPLAILALFYLFLAASDRGRQGRGSANGGENGGAPVGAVVTPARKENGARAGNSPVAEGDRPPPERV